MSIDLSSWLNSVTNLPEVWEQIIDEALTNRHGEFTYHYEDTIIRKKEDTGLISYTKPYTIDMTINIDTKYDDMPKDILEKHFEKKSVINTLHEIVPMVCDYIMFGEGSVDEISKQLKELKKT